MQKVKAAVSFLQRFVDRPWYPFLIAFLALLDNILVIIPTDGILVSTSVLRPKRWALFAVSVAIGSTLGALVLAYFVETQGLEWIHQFYPHIESTKTWIWAEKFFDRFGLIVVFLVAATPLAQQPTVILASLAETPLLQLGLVLFAGRLPKFLVMAYLGSHAPKLLTKVWGLQGELDEAGVTKQIQNSPPKKSV